MKTKISMSVNWPLRLMVGLLGALCLLAAWLVFLSVTLD